MNPRRAGPWRLLALLLAAAATVAVQAATITFEEAIPGPGNVTNQYCVSPVLNQGVRFLERDPIDIERLHLRFSTHDH
jgi:hypothetical protein